MGESAEQVQQIVNFAQEIELRSPPIAQPFREGMAIKLINTAESLQLEGRQTEAFAAVSTAQKLDPDIDISPIGYALAQQWDDFEAEDPVQNAEAFAAGLDDPLIADSFRAQLPQRFIDEAEVQIYAGQELAEVLALATIARDLDPQVGASPLGAAFAGTWPLDNTFGRVNRVQSFAADLESDFPDAAQEFLQLVPQTFIAQAMEAAENQDRASGLEPDG